MPTLQFDVAGLNAVVAKMDELVRQMERQQGATRRLSDDHRGFERTATQAIRSVESATERYNRILGEMKKALDAGKLSGDQFARAKVQLNKEMDNSTGRFRQFNAELSKSKDGWMDFAGGLAAKMGTVASAAGAIHVVREALERYNAELAKAQQSASGALGGSGLLKQLALGDQEKYDFYIKQSEELFGAGAVPTKDQAYRAVFSMHSAGMGDAFNIIKQLAATGVIENIPGAMQGLGTLYESMGKEEVGGATQAFGKAFAASQFAQATVEQVLTAFAKPGSFAGEAGISDEEVFAALSALADPSGGIDVAATAMRQFLQQMSIKGMTTVMEGQTRRVRSEEEMAEAVQMMGLTPGKMRTLLGGEAGQRYYESILLGEAGPQFRAREAGETQKHYQGYLDKTKQRYDKDRQTFLDSMADAGLDSVLEGGIARQRSLQEMVLAVQSMNMDPATLAEFIGGKRGMTFYSNFLRNQGQYAQALGAVDAANKDQRLAMRTTRVLDPTADAERHRVAEENMDTLEASTGAGIKTLYRSVIRRIGDEKVGVIRADDTLYESLQKGVQSWMMDIATGVTSPAGRISDLASLYREGKLTEVEAKRFEALLKRAEEQGELQEEMKGLLEQIADNTKNRNTTVNQGNTTVNNQPTVGNQ